MWSDSDSDSVSETDLKSNALLNNHQNMKMKQNNEEDLRKVKLPSYLRDCWKLPRNTKDHTLIRNNPSDLKHICLGFGLTLLHLNNDFNVGSKPKIHKLQENAFCKYVNSFVYPLLIGYQCNLNLM